MYRNHCCGISQLFSKKKAQKELFRYKKKGPGKITRKLIEQIEPYFSGSEKLLDIGGGVGAIQWAFLSGTPQTATTTGIDASSGFLNAALSYARERGWTERCKMILSDFTQAEGLHKSYDIVCLDKVICCYPDYQGLLEKALGLCDNILVLSFPPSGWIFRTLSLLGTLYFKLTRNPFRSYMHNHHEVKEFINQHGFRLISQVNGFPMNIYVFQKITA